MKLLAIDGNSILNRAFYGIRPLSNTQGVFTHAIFGFMNIYLKNRDEVQPDAVAVAFDLRKPTFRHKAVATYKANRKGMPEELAMQLPYVKQLLTLLGIPVITCEGYEADDILGTLAAACTAQDADCVILTGDRDSLQLVSDHVTVRLTTNKETIPYPTRIQRAEWALEHQSAATPQFAGDFALHRLAEIRNLARFSVFEPQQYSCKGGFAGSGSADHRKALPRTYVDINIVQHLTTLLFRTVVFADAATLQHCGFFVFARHNRSPYLVSASIRNDSARAEVTNCEATLVCGDCRISAVCPDSATRPSAST